MVGVHTNKRGNMRGNMRGNKRGNKRGKIALAVVAMGVAAALAALCLVPYQRTSSVRPADAYEAEIARVTSPLDADGDGLDDQTDILQGALGYVATQPKYESRYYAGGYPDDGFGVCTDVVAFACKDAGYDLKWLVADDIAAAPEAYAIEEPDPAIDFRRVRNLRVFFPRIAKTLTSDLSAVEEWQGGDIVVFEDHIGVVSERRNARGVPYVIHHNGPFQTAYEQDILESRDDLVGHYRMP